MKDDKEVLIVPIQGAIEDYNPFCSSAIEKFVLRVYARAEKMMQETGKLEGMHYAAIQLELADLKKRYHL